MDLRIALLLLLDCRLAHHMRRPGCAGLYGRHARLVQAAEPICSRGDHYCAGVEVRHHLQFCVAAVGGVRFRNTYVSDREIRIPADHLVIAQGRVPVAAPDVKPLGVPARRIGDCDTPRSLEEAVLDATIAVQQLTLPRRSPASASPALV